MQIYFYYALDEGGHIFARHDIEAVSDADAITSSWDYSAQDEDHHGFEVWIGRRLVFQSRVALDSFQAGVAKTAIAGSSHAFAR